MSFYHNASARLARRAVLSLMGAASLTMLAAISAHAANDQKNSRDLTVGIATMPTNTALEALVVDAKKQGLNVKLVEFSDWTTPNIAVANGDLDLNYFQHQPFLEDSQTKGGYKLVAVGLGYSTFNGIYAKKIKSLDELKSGDTVAIASDPINTGRALRLLEDSGLVTLKPGVGYRGIITDIADNPKKLKIVQVDGPQIARALDDVAAVVTYPAFAKLGGLDPNTPIVLEKPNDLYALRFVTRPELADDPRIKQFIALYQGSEELKANLRKYYGRAIDFPWERKAEITPADK